MTDDSPSATRRTVLKTVPAAVASLAVTGTASAAGDLSPPAKSAAGVFGFNARDIPVTYRFEQPSWIVSTTAGDLSELVGDTPSDDKGWVARHQDRYEIRRDDTADQAVIAAPAGHVGVSSVDRVFGRGLLTAGYVESVALDIDVEYPAPVSATTPGEFDPTANLARVSRWTMDEGDLDDGLAYDEDMPEVTIQTVREVTKATASDFGGVLPNTGGLTIAVLDTGVNAGGVFEDDVGATRILDASTNYTDSSEPTVGSDGLDAVADGEGHGTWVASCAAGDPSDSVYQGYAPAADILAYKVLDDSGSGSAGTIAKAVRAAADYGADVAVMSLGSAVYNEALTDAVTYAAGAGMPCVIAAGNSRHTTRWTASPADAEDAVTVTACTAETARDAKSAAFSQVDPDPGTTDFSGGRTTGRHVDLAAPGCKIEVMTPGGTSRLSGTSMAAPCVAGGLLLLYAADSAPRGDVEATRERFEHAQPAQKIGVTESGHGMLDVAAMVNETEPDESLEDARNSTAENRDAAHRALSDTQGGRVTRFLS